MTPDRHLRVLDGGLKIEPDRHEVVLVTRFGRGGRRQGTRLLCSCGEPFEVDASPSQGGRDMVMRRHQRHLTEVAREADAIALSKVAHPSSRPSPAIEFQVVFTHTISMTLEEWLDIFSGEDESDLLAAWARGKRGVVQYVRDYLTNLDESLILDLLPDATNTTITVESK